MVHYISFGGNTNTYTSMFIKTKICSTTTLQNKSEQPFTFTKQQPINVSAPTASSTAESTAALTAASKAASTAHLRGINEELMILSILCWHKSQTFHDLSLPKPSHYDGYKTNMSTTDCSSGTSGKFHITHALAIIWNTIEPHSLN